MDNTERCMLISNPLPQSHTARFEVDLQNSGSDVNCMNTSDILRLKFLTSLNTDVVVRFKNTDVIYRAHKLILIMWSPYFAKIFKENICSPTKISLDFIEPEAFLFMLRFMYDDSPWFTNCEESLKVYNVAVKFKVFKLIVESLNFVRHYTPKIYNVLTVLNAALCMNLKSQILNCSQLIQNNTLEVLYAIELSQVTSTVMSHVLNLPSFTVHSYNDILCWFFDWVDANYMLNKTSYSSLFLKNSPLQKFLPLLNFLSLSCTEFVNFCSRKPDFIDDVLGQEDSFSILMNISKPHSWPLPEWVCQNEIYAFQNNKIVKASYDCSKKI